MHNVDAMQAVADDPLPSGDAIGAEPASLTDDLAALFDDGKTLLDAELQFQRTRAAFVFGKARVGAGFAVAAAAILHLALVALVVGAVIALTPVLGAWLATLVVVAVLTMIGLFLATLARKRFKRAVAAFGGHER